MVIKTGANKIIHAGIVVQTSNDIQQTMIDQKLGIYHDEKATLSLQQTMYIYSHIENMELNEQAEKFEFWRNPDDFVGPPEP